MINLKENNRGQILVLVALSLIVLLGFAALAIDVGYFYHTKNQLQGAADAAALAGALALDGSNNLAQTAPGTEAVKYATLNRASGSAVQLDPSDIILGSWVANSFIPSGTPVNAVKVIARKTTNDPAGFPRIFGKIFDTTKQDIKPEAVATRPARSSTFISLCSTACTIPSYCISTATTPTMCTISPPRILDTSSPNPSNQFAWTSLTVSPTSASGVSSYICADSPFEDNCDNSVYTTNGTVASTLKDLESTMYDLSYERTAKETIVISGSTKIDGWWVIAPVITACPPGSNSTHTVTHYAKIRIKAICGTGGFGCKGNYTASNMGPPNVCNGVPNNSIVIDQIQCVPCGDPGQPQGYKSVLVQ